MNVKFENNLDNNTMSMTITVKKREFVNEEHVVFGWPGAEKALAEYKCPSTHTLGNCHNKYKKINNDYDQACQQTWVFDLNTKETKKPRRKKATAKK